LRKYFTISEIIEERTETISLTISDASKDEAWPGYAQMVRGSFRKSFQRADDEGRG